MTPCFDDLSIGLKIIRACGSEESGCVQYPVDEDFIVEGIKETITLLKNHRFFSNTKLKTPCVVQSLYILSGKRDEEREKVYNRASTQIIIEFLEWLISIPALKNRLHEIKDLLKTFVFDLGSTGVLGEKFFSVHCGRNKTNHTYFHFYDSKNALFLNRPLPFKTQEFLSVFGLRQAMEIKYRRVIGFIGTEPPIKMRHDVIPSIISNHEKDIFFHKRKDLTIKDILHIYNWTNYSIHYLVSAPPWLIWKAFEVCGIIFDTNNEGPALAIGFDSAFQFSVQTLIKMRDALTKEIQRISNTQKASYDVHWGNPEAFVIGDDNRTIDVNDLNINDAITINPDEDI